ncbi:hypothetical protein FE257_010860 [Aspergillus nanangensis]|uniref:AMP-dependent synthetase/ligase domain-containing protein n=1 Tax=Aspergillus nanangensis TaxID=2582783 RepID=A0AAD4GZD0_ASPNN|nr:hypothetical protein FE257_010860 [Aspergillus nanangensis]
MAGAIAAAAAVGSATLASYLNAKFHIREDLNTFFYGSNPRNALEYLTKKVAEDRLLLYHVLEDQANDPAVGDKEFVVFPTDGRTWTYKQFLQDVNRVGNWLLQELGIQKGEMVALDGVNSPEFLMVWFALDSIGANMSFVNYNLTGKSLEHCLKLCEARYCLVDEEVRHLADPVAASYEQCKMVYYTAHSLASLPYPTSAPPEERRRNIAPTGPKCLLYTSGTTGMPKAVVKTVAFETSSGRSCARYLGLKRSNRFYTCLPLFHGAAHALKKFSHSTFWPEVVSSQADTMQYVGELCRYLINGKPTPLDRQHKIQMAWGNGMRPDVWEPFRQRFGIPIIHELYAASDGMGAMYNRNEGDFSRHAIAIRGLLWNTLKGPYEKMIKIDVVTQEITRDPRTGFAIECARGEPGETIHWINAEEPQAQFEGYYRNKEATNKRFIRDVFRKGDMWFRSGDMMRQDDSGCVYFVDRLGDTYRWKSENVSTNEVSDIMGRFAGIAECNVYGVLVPNADGRAGCAAVVLADGVTEDALDFNALGEYALASMPRYAAPVFLRVTPSLGYTSTMKLQKGKLRQEGCDVAMAEAAGDKMYWLPPNGLKYVPFTQEEYARLKSGEIRL